MNVKMMRTEDLIPYVNNPRKNDGEAVDKVASSIKQFGFKVPIIVDSDNEIVAGHTRHKAAKKLNMDKVPVVVADDLTEQQVKAFRIADNKVSEYSEWDMELLEIELSEIEDFTGFEDEIDTMFDEEENPYTDKVQTPEYEITGDKPNIDELVDTTKTDYLLARIEESNLNEQEKEFLKMSAYRHLKFDYSKIAEFYAHSEEEIQDEMERSALVIIDYEKAIEYGFVKVTETIDDMMEEGQ